MFFDRAGVVVSKKAKPAKSVQIPGPSLGWVHTAMGRKKGSAAMLRNMFPTLEGAKMRGGMMPHATAVTDSAIDYILSTGADLFAFCGGGIYNVTTAVDPLEDKVPVYTGLTGSKWSSVSFTTPGGTFHVCVNGLDDMMLFDGTDWQAVNDASSPAITEVETSSFTQVWKFKNRLFFIAGKSAWYLPVLSIGGEAEELPLGGIFNKSGELLFGATWSLDAGDGLDDVCLFVTVDGEVAVYQGTDPGAAETWSLSGVYQIASPVDKDGWFKAGGDLAVMTRDGIVPISQAINADRVGLTSKAITIAIEDPLGCAA